MPHNRTLLTMTVVLLTFCAWYMSTGVTFSTYPERVNIATVPSLALDRNFLLKRNTGDDSLCNVGPRPSTFENLQNFYFRRRNFEDASRTNFSVVGFNNQFITQIFKAKCAAGLQQAALWLPDVTLVSLGGSGKSGLKTFDSGPNASVWFRWSEIFDFNRKQSPNVANLSLCFADNMSGTPRFRPGRKCGSKITRSQYGSESFWRVRALFPLRRRYLGIASCFLHFARSFFHTETDSVFATKIWDKLADADKCRQDQACMVWTAKAASAWYNCGVEEATGDELRSATLDNALPLVGVHLRRGDFYYYCKLLRNPKGNVRVMPAFDWSVKANWDEQRGVSISLSGSHSPLRKIRHTCFPHNAVIQRAWPKVVVDFLSSRKNRSDNAGAAGFLVYVASGDPEMFSLIRAATQDTLKQSKSAHRALIINFRNFAIAAHHGDSSWRWPAALQSREYPHPSNGQSPPFTQVDRGIIDQLLLSLCDSTTLNRWSSFSQNVVELRMLRRQDGVRLFDHMQLYWW